MKHRTEWFEELQKNVSDLIARSPVADVERNVRGLMTQAFSKLDLVPREDFDIQAELLRRARADLQQLVLRVEVLEAKLAERQGGPAAALSSDSQEQK
ncbi:accessory factor UbiK family protein [Corticimicrobacter populi]|uniref:Ubiquinone biosynthesis accessory factor UbiK n=1 Tax=Corticimicrobacter populi TaxID=2175229 RepID=A0A2V1K1M7_9BURK|nr:accessory factor UbiK family protein [Corticimicrobacter populi]PWF23043.1 hypothetical protein DD235_08550 [Corticimicrobacter populi]QDQ87603.1 accessory factor UbiK family protein [Alcaligenaceae bacterium SJ-26]